MVQPPSTRILLDGHAETVQPDGEFIYYCDNSLEFRRVGLATGDATTRIHGTCGVIDHQGHGYYRQQSNEGPLMQFPLTENAAEAAVAGAASLPTGTPFGSDGTRVFFRRRDALTGTTEPSMFAWSAAETLPLVMGSRDYYALSWANGHLAWFDLPGSMFSVAADGSASVHTQQAVDSRGDLVGAARAGTSFYWAWNAGASNGQIGTINSIVDGQGPTANVTTVATEVDCGFHCVNGLTADSGYVYWTSRANLAVRRVAVGGSQVETVFWPTACGPGPIQEYGGRLYWLETCESPSAQVLVSISKP
jgi:hypothetical protein